VSTPDVTVVAVLRSAPGLFGILDARRLHAGVSRWVTRDWRHRWEFKLFTDRSVPGISCIPLRDGWLRWWAKLPMFEPGALRGPILYLDLDTVVVGDLDELMELPSSVDAPAALEDFYAPGKRASGVLAWDADRHGEELADAWRRFCADPPGVMRANPRRMDSFLGPSFERADPIQRMLPGQVVSYKIHCEPKHPYQRHASVPEGARLVCFHGRPRLRELPANDPVRLAWEDVS
jgi:hypothetical protein